MGMVGMLMMGRVVLCWYVGEMLWKKKDLLVWVGLDGVVVDLK